MGKLTFSASYRAFERFSASLSGWSLRLCHLLLVLLVGIILLSVFYRYLLESPLQWSEEAARYLLIWLSLIGASVAMRERRDVRLTALVRHLPQPRALLLEVVLHGTVVVFITLIAVYSLRMIFELSVKTTAASLRISMVWAHSALPAGFILILIQALYILADDIRKLRREGFRPSPKDKSEGGMQSY